MKYQVIRYETASRTIHDQSFEGMRRLEGLGEKENYIAERNMTREDELGAATRMAAQFLVTTVLSSFAAEVCLKVLIEEGGARPVRGHHLRDLLDQCPQDVRERIRDKVCRRIAIRQTEFDEQLAANSRIFQEWRYDYEFEEAATAHMPLIEALLQAAKDEMKPIELQNPPAGHPVNWPPR